MKLSNAKKKNIEIIHIESKHYPKLLKEISSPPLILYVKGNKTVLNSLSIGIVGSRKPTLYGKENAYNFAQQLAYANWTIVSGLALGIDTLAHQVALTTTGKTIAVMGCGLDTIYPKENQLISEKICEKGVIMSEFHLKTLPKPHHFPRRNRIIAGLCRGVLVIEAAIKSGSLITAKYALNENREIFAIPGNINNHLSKGVNQLIKQGAKLIEDIDDILTELSHYNNKALKTDTTPHHNLAEAAQKVYDAISLRTTGVDVIVWQSKLNTSEVLSILTQLELMGCIKKVPGGYLKNKEAL